MASSEPIKQKLEAVKGEIEHLQVQLSLGKAEAVEQFEQQKDALRSRLEQAKEAMEAIAAKGEEKVKPLQQELQQRLEELRVQLALGRAESVETFREQEQALSQSLYAVKQRLQSGLDEAQAKGQQDVAKALSLLDEQTKDFKGRMEMFRVQLALGEAEARQEWEKFSKEFMETAQQFSQRVDRELDGLEDRAEAIGEEVAERFYDLKKSFLDMFR